MIDAGLSPRDPVRWWLALRAEQAREQRDAAGKHGAGDIQVMD